MFGLIVSGRLVDAAPQAITEAQYAFKIPPTPAFSHIVVFMLPGTQLPPGTAATVFIQLPPSQEFKLLGGIGPGKESAIFKVSGLKASGGSGNIMVDDTSANVDGAMTGDIVVGVSIEPETQVAAQLATLQSGRQSSHEPQASNSVVKLESSLAGRVTTKVLAQRIIGNAFNFLASFGSDTVPLKAFQDWWTKFEKKVDMDPSFLERGE